MVASIRAFGPAAYDERQVTAWAHVDDPVYPVDDPGQLLLVAEVDGEDGEAVDGDDGDESDGAPVFAGVGHVAPAEEEVYAVYVHPDHAREGVGTALLEELEAAARDRGCDRLGLTASRNAVPFYEAAGYERTGSVEHDPTGPHDVTLECVRMRKRL